MAVRPDRTTLILLVAGVVEHAEERLEEEHDEDEDANDRVIFLKLVRTKQMLGKLYCRRRTYISHVCREPDAHAERDNVDQIGERLESCVEPHQAREAHHPDGDCTHWKEDDKSKSRHHSVRYQDRLFFRVKRRVQIIQVIRARVIRLALGEPARGERAW